MGPPRHPIDEVLHGDAVKHQGIGNQAPMAAPPHRLGAHDRQYLAGPRSPFQLRQRVAFALSEILVVSDVNGTLFNNPRGMANYYDILVRGATGFLAGNRMGHRRLLSGRWDPVALALKRIRRERHAPARSVAGWLRIDASEHVANSHARLLQTSILSGLVFSVSR